MQHWRRAYYNKFSRFYDGFVALHSRDRQNLARKLLSERVPIQRGGSVLDVCTGTATLLPYLQAKVGRDGSVVGVDFSRGMLTVGREKTRNLRNIYLAEADAGRLPFVDGAFDAVTCSHAFYELKRDTQNRALREVFRVLRPKGTFLMMEHDIPPNPFVRVPFYLRFASMGAARAITFLRHEQEVLEGYFGSVEKVAVSAGRSKVLVCRK